jgi:anaerobic ribonucleoside-triphosphate reductase activating protein
MGRLATLAAMPRPTASKQRPAPAGSRPGSGAQSLRLHDFLECSRANGPGRRAVLWVQGCSLSCPGCFNPGTHSFSAGQTVPIDQLFARIRASGAGLEGLTVSGGEPMQQADAVAALLARIRRDTALSVVLFTGFTWAELVGKRSGGVQQRFLPAAAGVEAVLRQVDVLIAGRYDQNRRLASALTGSANKTIHFLTARYTPADLQAVPEAEVLITPRGETVLSGIEPVRW